MKRSTGMTKKIPKKRKNIVEVEAGKENIEVEAEVEIQESAVEAGAKKRQVNIKMRVKKNQINEAGVAVEEELAVLKSQENGNTVPAKKNPENVAEAKSVLTNESTVIARTSLTNRIAGGARVQSARAKKSSIKAKMRLCEVFCFFLFFSGLFCKSGSH